MHALEPEDTIALGKAHFRGNPGALWPVLLRPKPWLGQGGLNA